MSRHPLDVFRYAILAHAVDADVWWHNHCQTDCEDEAINTALRLGLRGTDGLAALDHSPAWHFFGYAKDDEGLGCGCDYCEPPPCDCIECRMKRYGERFQFVSRSTASFRAVLKYIYRDRYVLRPPG